MMRDKKGKRKITMTLIQTVIPNHITLYGSKQGSSCLEVGALIQMFEKSDSELKPQIT